MYLHFLIFFYYYNVGVGGESCGYPAKIFHARCSRLILLTNNTFLQCFTHDPSVGHRIPPQRRTPMTFANFTRELFEPYIVREVTKGFQEAKASMGEFITATQLEWQNKMVTNANRWMKIQQVEYRKLDLSDQIGRASCRERVSGVV